MFSSVSKKKIHILFVKFNSKWKVNFLGFLFKLLFSLRIYNFILVSYIISESKVRDLYTV